MHGKSTDGEFSVINNEKFLAQKQPNLEGSVNPNDIFLLKPDPIMRLNQCLGMHPRFNSSSIIFHKNAKYGSDLIYGTANMIIAMNSKTMKQRFLIDHTDHVRKITMTSEFIISVAKPSKNNKKVNKKKKFNKLVEEEEIQVIVWDIHSGSNLVSFKPPLIEISDLFVSFSRDVKQSYLVVIGIDYQGRDLILAYAFPDMVNYGKIELVARQLSDFTVKAVQRHPFNGSIFVTGGKENIRFWRIKGGIVTGTSIILNKLGRGKHFTSVMFDYEFYGEENMPPNSMQKNSPIGKIHWVYLSTACGHIFQINYSSREIEKVLQIHNDCVTSMKMTIDRKYCITSSLDCFIRIFSHNFSTCYSELKTSFPIIDISLNIYSTTLATLSSTGCIGVYEIESQQYSTIMRSHIENVNSIDYMNKTDTLVTASSGECSVKIWDQASKTQLYEFVTDNDFPEIVACHPLEPYLSVGYKSGMVRVFDSVLSKLIYENMIFESSIKDLKFSKEGRLLASIHENSRIVIFDVEKDFAPIKTFDYDFPNNNYFSIDFSNEGNLMANISTNANTITIWETINFTLRYEIDLTGNLLYKLRFAPNGRDLLVLTTTSKFKFFRIGVGEISEYKEVPGIHDHSCMDFEISPNNKYIVT